MIKLKQAVIVEGKFDKIRLSELLDAVIITTDGFGVFKDRGKLDLIRLFAKKHGIIILTDSDSAGFLIRNHLKGQINEGEIHSVYIPDVFGKEKRKAEASKDGKLGVEGIEAAVLERLFAPFVGATIGRPNDPRTARPYIDNQRLFDDGLSGKSNSAQLRKKLQKELNLPENLSAKQLPGVLNSLFTEEEYIKALEKI
jgi:ribonuclease M5